MRVETMREQVYRAYPGTSWQRRVNSMKDSEVIAIYYRLFGKK